MTEMNVAVDQAMALARDLAAHGSACPGLWQSRAKEIVAAIEPPVSADLLAAREAAAEALERMAERYNRRASPFATSGGRIRLREADRTSQPVATAIQEVRHGLADDADIVQDMLCTVERGREIAAEEHRRQRMADMIAAPALREVPGRLTITVDGPQGSGKTGLAEWLMLHGAFRLRRGFGPGTVVQPDIIEIRDGRRFDVRNDVFVEG